jgi:hypothetical protein
MMSLFCRLIETRHATQIFFLLPRMRLHAVTLKILLRVVKSMASQIGEVRLSHITDPKISAKKCDDMHLFLFIYIYISIMILTVEYI